MGDRIFGCVYKVKVEILIEFFENYCWYEWYFFGVFCGSWIEIRSGVVLGCVEYEICVFVFSVCEIGRF